MAISSKSISHRLSPLLGDILRLGSGKRNSHTQVTAQHRLKQHHPSQRGAQHQVSFLQLQYPLTKGCKPQHAFLHFFQCGLQFKASHMQSAPSGSLPLFVHEDSTASASTLTSPATAFLVQLLLLWVLTHTCPQTPPLAIYTLRWNEPGTTLVASSACILQVQTPSLLTELFYCHPSIKQFCFFQTNGNTSWKSTGCLWRLGVKICVTASCH